MSLERKIVLSRDLSVELADLARPLVMTNGVFDVLHSGHVSYLERASELGASLIVGLNSDASVSLLGKGPERPFNTADDRAFVLAGLASVDLVTFFDSRKPIELIKAVRPDIYVKGGDYDIESLEETYVVRSWGGQSQTIPFVEGFSTTSLVQRIQNSKFGHRKAVFLDRDGVINKDFGYVHHWDDFEFIPGAIEAMRKLQASGYALVIVTNQSGLARGFYTQQQYHELTEKYVHYLASQQVFLDGVYYCPHHPKGTVPSLTKDCECRKPAPGMFYKAVRELDISLVDSVMIGDKTSDIDAARAAGVGRIFSVDSENAGAGPRPTGADSHFASLFHCVSHVLPGIFNATT